MSRAGGEGDSSMSRYRSILGCAGALVLLLGAQPHALARDARDPVEPTGRWALRSFGDAALPPMGWSSWNAFHTQIDEAKVMGAAEAIVHDGLRDLGYRYINIDDGWWQKRRQPDGRMVVRTDSFPSAAGQAPGETSLRPLVDRLHALGLRAGIYSDIGRNACSQGYPESDTLLPTGTVAEREVGLYEHVAQDLGLYFDDWRFDYIKVDGCGLNAFSPDKPAVKAGQFRAFPALVVSDSVNQTRIADIRALFAQVRDVLVRLRPAGDFVLSICNWGTANVRAWGRDIGNLWRTSDDIEPRWSRMLYNFDSVATRELYSGPGHWNDPDMLYVGQGDFDAGHPTAARTHFALWAIEDAPLMIGYDLRQAPQSLLDVFAAPEIVAVNQDPAGNQGVLAYTSDDLEIIVKQLAARDEKAVVLFNRGTEPVKATLTAAHLKFRAGSPVQLRDLWQRRDLAPFTGETTFALAPRESVTLRARGRPELAAGIYLSEMPARVYVAADGIRALQPDPEIHRPAGMGEGATRGTGARAALAGWGGPRADSTPYDNELRLRGTPYTSGIGALANSRLQVRADRQFGRFSAEVGVDDSSPERRTKVRFEVYGDGRRLAVSPALGAGDPAFRLNAGVAGVGILELVAREVGRGATPAVVTWGAAALAP
jgi:hypothetical protein